MSQLVGCNRICYQISKQTPILMVPAKPPIQSYIIRCSLLNSHGTMAPAGPHLIIQYQQLYHKANPSSWYHGTSGASLNHTTSVTITKRTHLLHGTIAPAGPHLILR